MDPETALLAAETKALKTKMETAKRRYYAKAATYDEMADAAKAFARAFEAYHLARFGKRKRLDFRALLR